ncbi:MAG: hypothetical protein WCK49_08815 [Myxococcaceae bacterium]
MDELFAQRLKAASRAGWWMLLIAVGMQLIQWGAYSYLMAKQPEGLLALLGPDMSWEAFQEICIWFATAFKLAIWVLFLLVVWVSLWAKQSRT